MANRQRGEVDLVVNGTTYRFRMTFNAQCELEARLSTPTREVSYLQVIRGVQAGRSTEMRAFLWAGLLTQHPEITLEQVGDLIQQMGGLDEVSRQLIEAASPDPKDAEALKSDRPPTAPTDPTSGTGGASSSTPVAAV